MMNFIGIGAQKSGTSWVYACLYEHPQICAPIKEIHFFSRPRFEKGREWYEAHFKNCEEGKKCGEFSTSYLYSKESPERIRALYPNTKLIAILRNPVERAYSQYRNAIKAGEIEKTVSFETYMVNEESVRAQGLYTEQLERYYARFPKEQILVLIYEDIEKNPEAFMKRIYQFLGVDDSFISSMLYDRINTARTPRAVFIERAMHHTAENLRKWGLGKLVHAIRKLGAPDVIRSMNTEIKERTTETQFDRDALSQYFRDDVTRLSTLLSRDMRREWNI